MEWKFYYGEEFEESYKDSCPYKKNWDEGLEAFNEEKEVDFEVLDEVDASKAQICVLF